MNKIKKIIKENWKFIIFYIILFFIFTFPLPYYIEMPGGVIDIKDRIKIENQDKLKGNFYLSYVSTIDGNVINYLFSFLNKDWERVKKQEFVIENESIEASNKRSKLMLSDANQIALYVAYKKAGKKINLKSSKVFVYYVSDEADTEVEVGDQVIKVENTPINDLDSLVNFIKKTDKNELNFTVLRDGKEQNLKASFKEQNNEKLLGIAFHYYIEITTKPKVTFDFKEEESGPSGGLMMTLAIYNQLGEDITHGLKIAGTGTMDLDGSVGAIDGVKYKIMGAAKKKMDIFFVPKDNYKEAIKIKKEKKYKMKIVSVSTFDEALDYLKNIK